MQKNRNWLFRFFRDKNLKYYNSRIKTPPYLELDEFFPDYRILEENWEVIKLEVERIVKSGKTLPKFHEVDNGQSYISDNDGVSWSLITLLLYNSWHKENIKMCSKTTAILKGLRGVKSAYFSILSPGKIIPPHVGPYKGIIRYQLALSIPKEGECKLIVDGKDYFWKEGKSVLFDDTYLHEVQNNTDEMRIALLLDIKRKIPGFLRYYDLFIFKLIQLILVLNNTFTKSKIK
ncbi:MAG: aspartyl/asparaginyl beta-hydroxylase domain-containing protein [Flavobacteriales bacterium]|jgi:aspartyl/asparaginyl beta-hydroxylase (cupin superfamily)|nr:aspartyl/asparaginyl beta-hydroxylase domain-containing protein [Flavobacteriales bacterium]MBT5353540.1 aspartyl/asparaginyl beta-hydroxylase domain-containing protein [Flavobacteriales bacterium]MBT7620140.1 aspartyl/asparaginyl beta-hydroxylase domain-containing protein [Flavobacteriales bacterium]MBT7726989.1 aspartyl/asparaginyl beta-hydroxylase domain-containing protein [Flavobacteriales bacterium]